MSNFLIIVNDLGDSEYHRLKNENTQLLHKIQLLKSDLSKFRDNCDSFNEKTEKEIKMMQKVAELEEILKEKDQTIMSLKMKNLDLTKEIFQNKEKSRLEKKCQSLQEQLQGKKYFKSSRILSYFSKF